MQIVSSPLEMRAACKAYQRAKEQETIGLVPTMGALHEGHLSLVRASRQRCDRTVVSIFVNPLQFGPTEDLARYPRTFEQDCRMLEEEGVDFLFAPSPEEMYSPGSETIVDVPVTGGRLDGASRPGHFRGVATVVAKLFNIVQPDCAFFGEKDAAQVAVLRKMVRDLNFDLNLIVCPTVREASELAMSSRNRYLNEQERVEAKTLSRSLRAVADVVRQGERRLPVIRETLRETLAHSSLLKVDYADLVDPETLAAVEEDKLPAETLVAVAGWIGTTRLIDNCTLRIDGANE
ncbi:pantoate--beta-alanine ligase [Terriglobus roseus]|uniref:Pantothenate synthetase n=1 Tax=Terriglobus roseus TaxID=392734 RepID=A0A1G7GVZ1_9BACT|nr:pantoate--beta-alanine ligase [Terriglobus roseus]SDE92340.1 pantothenate synthetase [Terriglobus roseus]